MAHNTTDMQTLETAATFDFTESATTLPFKKEHTTTLIRHHSVPELEAFVRDNSDLFAQNQLLVPYDGQVARTEAGRARPIESTDLVKPLYFIGSRAYFFMNQEDLRAVGSLDQQRRDECRRRYGKHMIPINAPVVPTTTTKLTLKLVKRRRHSDEESTTEESREQTKRPRQEQQLALVTAFTQNQERVVALNTQLALEQQHRLHQEQTHQLEKELMRHQYEAEIHARDMAFMQLQLSVAQQFQQSPVDPAPLSSTTTTTMPRITLLRPQPQAPQRLVHTVEHWLNAKLYGQDLTAVQPPNAPKFHGFYDDSVVAYDLIKLQLYTVQRHTTLLLNVPLSYNYRLTDALDALATNQNFVADLFRSMRAKCPADYTVRLLMNRVQHQMDGSVTVIEEVNHRNVAVILFHLQACLLVYDNNTRAKTTSTTTTTATGEKVKTKGKEKSQCRLTMVKYEATRPSASLEIMDAYYPECGFFGPQTYVSPTLCLRVRNPSELAKKGEYSIGSGKTCRFCLIRDRTHTATTNKDVPQFTHFMKSCPHLAMLSNNKAVVLAAVQLACRQNKDLRKHEFFFGKNFTLTDSTLLRHATPEELISGEHVNGLALNEKEYLRMREDQHKQLQYQLKNSPLFGPLDARLHFLSRLLLQLPHTHTSTLASLMVSTDLQPFVLKPRSFEDGDNLFFSLAPDASLSTQLYQDARAWEHNCQVSWAQEQFQQFQQQQQQQQQLPQYGGDEHFSDEMNIDFM